MFDDPMEPPSFLNEEEDDAQRQDSDRSLWLNKPDNVLRGSVVKKRPILLSISLSLNMLLIDRLIFAKVTTVEAFFDMTTLPYAYASILLTVLSAIIFGLALAKRGTSIGNTSSKADWLAWLQIVLGGAFVILSVGCPVCGSPVLSAIGFQDGLGLFPLGGLELKLASIILLWSSFKLSPVYKKEMVLTGDVTMDDLAPVLNRSPQTLFQRIRPTLFPIGIILALLSLPLLPPVWKVDFSTGQVLPNALSFGSVAEIGISELVEQVIPTDGYEVAVAYGDLGPQLLDAGAIDYDRFVERYEKGGAPLSDLQKKILTEGVDEPIVIQRDNAHFLLNFFWALGLTNKNPILDEGPMMEYSEGDIGRFASTGGWTLGQKDPTELYSSATIIQLSPEQQSLVEKVASVVFRPCCNNPTIFPDCNHGMAMLGLLELLAAEGLTEDQMLETAKYSNAFWFPQQSLEVATYFQTTKGLSFSEVDAELVVGPQIFSGSGFQGVHAWLGENGLLEESPNQGGSCGV